MANRGKSIQQRANRQREQHRADGRCGHKGAQDQIPAASAYCPVCFLTFGSQERRAVWGGKVAHLRCGGKLRQAEVA